MMYQFSLLSSDSSEKYHYFFFMINNRLVWILFFIFTFGHLYSNYKAVSAVIMETINLPRYHILVCTYIETGKILTPKEVGKLDPVIRSKLLFSVEKHCLCRDPPITLQIVWENILVCLD